MESVFPVNVEAVGALLRASLRKREKNVEQLQRIAELKELGVRELPKDARQFRVVCKQNAPARRTSWGERLQRQSGLKRSEPLAKFARTDERFHHFRLDEIA